LELPLEATLDDLKRAFVNYTTWYCRKKGVQHKNKLDAWAAALMRQARLNLEKGLQQSRCKPPFGYPGMKEQIGEAQELLVFAPDDRAPHAIHCSCKLWYKQELQKRLHRADVYTPLELSWNEYKQQCESFCTQYGFVVGGGLPYVYGIWKSKKARWRHIVGISKDSEFLDSVNPLESLRASASLRWCSLVISEAAEASLGGP